MEIANKVKADIDERCAVGLKKYGRHLHTFNGRSALQDAYEEAIDLSQYLAQELMERQSIKQNVIHKIEKVLSAYDMPLPKEKLIELIIADIKEYLDEVI